MNLFMCICYRRCHTVGSIRGLSNSRDNRSRNNPQCGQSWLITIICWPAYDMPYWWLSELVQFEETFTVYFLIVPQLLEDYFFLGLGIPNWRNIQRKLAVPLPWIGLSLFSWILVKYLQILGVMTMTITSEWFVSWWLVCHDICFGGMSLILLLHGSLPILVFSLSADTGAVILSPPPQFVNICHCWWVVCHQNK